MFNLGPKLRDRKPPVEEKSYDPFEDDPIFDIEMGFCAKNHFQSKRQQFFQNQVIAFSFLTSLKRMMI